MNRRFRIYRFFFNYLWSFRYPIGDILNLNSRKKILVIMKSKKPRLIVLKDPKLRKIRTNLRVVLKLAYLNESKRLDRLEDLYIEKDAQKGLTPSQQKRDIQLGRMNNNLMTVYDNSILKCSLGAACNSYKEAVENGTIDPVERPIDLDMGWLPQYGSWFCKKDYESLKDFHIDEDYISV